MHALLFQILISDQLIFGRFDGVTSMLYKHHGLSKAFNSYDDYFNDEVDLSSITYLTLANSLKDFYPGLVTIAEDVSGMPTLCRPLEEGGIGFSYRFNAI